LQASGRRIEVTYINSNDSARPQGRIARGNRSDSKRRGRDARSVDDALSLINLNDKASFVEDLLFYRSDDELKIERPADDPAGQFDAEYDAYLLIRQLQRPTNHVGELHRLTQRALAGGTGI
jgi:hypothetical protein